MVLIKTSILIVLIKVLFQDVVWIQINRVLRVSFHCDWHDIFILVFDGATSNNNLLTERL